MPTTPGINTALPPSSDVLGEALQLLHLSGVLYCQAELTQPWGIDLPALEGVMVVEVITSGQCWVQLEGQPPVFISRGSIVLIPRGNRHKLLCNPEAETQPLSSIPIELVGKRFEKMQFGGGGELTQLTYCGVRFDHVLAHRLINVLPKMIHIRASDLADEWLHYTVGFIAREARNQSHGYETVITRLVDILVIQSIRNWIESASEEEQGWIAALRHPQIGRSLSAMHRYPERDWTVASLAGEAGMSRSGFSARFNELAGEPALHYLTTLRMQMARRLLLETADPLIRIAQRTGYKSEPAFSRAFRRVMGMPPGALRTRHRK